MGNLDYLTNATLQNCKNISHGFFSRLGGVSESDFDSLNCSYSSGDSEENVSENRKRISDSLGAKKLISLRQVHSATVFMVDQSWDSFQTVEGDGMVTTDSGIAIGVLGADCAPVLFADAEAGVVGAAHGGWKGAVLGVTDNVIRSMCERGATVETIRAVVGPAIQQQSYEVGLGFMEQFKAQSTIGGDEFFLLKNGSAYFDLPGYLVRKIQLAGVSGVEVLNNDTYSLEEKLFSYRRMCHRNEKDYGRQIGAISILK